MHWSWAVTCAAKSALFPLTGLSTSLSHCLTNSPHRIGSVFQLRVWPASTIHRILANPYYKGDVRFKGATYKGAHEAIVAKEVWYQVQTVLDSHKSAAEATQVHDHYLKDSVYCGQCSERLIITNARNRHGKVYPCFV